MSPNRTMTVVWPLLALMAIALGCEPEFDPITQVDGLRVMAIAADDPELVPGDTTTIRALVRANDEAGPVGYAWDWCPFEGTAADEYTCSLTQQDIDELAAELGVEAPQLALGATPEVEFNYNFAALLQIYCELVLEFLEEQDLPEGVELLECEDSQQITLRLIVTQPDGSRVIAVKRMVLYYEAPAEEVINNNPTIAGVRIVEFGTPLEDATALEEGVPFAVSYDTGYTVVLDVEESTAEAFTPEGDEQDPDPDSKRENLIATWYREGGAFEEDYTAYIDGASEDFSGLTENFWTAPEGGEREPGLINLYIILQDEREGLGWIVRTLRLE